MSSLQMWKMHHNPCTARNSGSRLPSASIIKKYGVMIKCIRQVMVITSVTMPYAAFMSITVSHNDACTDINWDMLSVKCLPSKNRFTLRYFSLLIPFLRLLSRIKKKKLSKLWYWSFYTRIYLYLFQVILQIF